MLKIFGPNSQNNIKYGIQGGFQDRIEALQISAYSNLGSQYKISSNKGSAIFIRVITESGFHLPKNHLFDFLKIAKKAFNWLKYQEKFGQSGPEGSELDYHPVNAENRCLSFLYI